jgi:GTP-binding protein
MEIRNIAIIAHVDHGKTTLVDGMLKQTHTFRDNQAEMTETTILDSTDLEREKGITILAKNTSVFWHDTKINIIDTPGHADFSGEVERVINMADGALLVIDAAEGPLPQTQFVLKQALEHKLKIIVLINKIDRKDARVNEVLKETEELFLRMATSEDQLNFRVLFGIGREGKVWERMPEKITDQGSLEPLFRTIVNEIPDPAVVDGPLRLLISSLDFDPHKGVIAIGKLAEGTVTEGDRVTILDENIRVATAVVEEVFTTKGLERVKAGKVQTGDIVAISGLGEIAIGQTVAGDNSTAGFPRMKIEEPTLKIVVSPNTSPFAGRESKFGSARQLAERLGREKKTNIGLKIEESEGGSSFVISGRGELHLSILLENMRREGYEMQAGRPEVIIREEKGTSCEPFEELTVEIEKAYVGVITEDMGKRKAELRDMQTDERGITRMIYFVSTRNLLGFRGDILTRTRGNGIFASSVAGYFPLAPSSTDTRNGVIISLETGKATAYALENLQARGKSFIGPGTPVYEGMVIGINNRKEDLEINICKSKKLTNVHSENADIAVHLDPPIIMALEQCLDFINPDELLEITPQNLRIRKIHLSKLERIRFSRSGKNLS